MSAFWLVSRCGGGGTHPVIDLGLELDTGLDDVDRGEGTVGDGAAEGTGNGEPGRRDGQKVSKEVYADGRPFDPQSQQRLLGVASAGAFRRLACIMG